MSNAVAKKTEQIPAEPVSETTAIIQMIERAARDETINIDKMRELLDMRKQIMTEAAEQKFNDAMALAQSEMKATAADASNTQTSSKYASYFALDKGVRPIYTKHGFALSFDTETVVENSIRLICHVSCNGFTRHYHIDLAADGKGAKGGDVMTKTHAIGSAISYGQRYLLKMIFNLAVGDDDDGNAAGAGDTISPEQVTELQDMLVKTGAPKDKFLKYMKAKTIIEIPEKKFEDAKAAINNWVATKKKTQ